MDTGCSTSVAGVVVVVALVDAGVGLGIDHDRHGPWVGRGRRGIDRAWVVVDAGGMDHEACYDHCDALPMAVTSCGQEGDGDDPYRGRGRYYYY